MPLIISLTSKFYKAEGCREVAKKHLTTRWDPSAKLQGARPDPEAPPGSELGCRASIPRQGKERAGHTHNSKVPIATVSGPQTAGRGPGGEEKVQKNSA